MPGRGWRAGTLTPDPFTPCLCPAAPPWEGCSRLTEAAAAPPQGGSPSLPPLSPEGDNPRAQFMPQSPPRVRPRLDLTWERTGALPEAIGGASRGFAGEVQDGVTAAEGHRRQRHGGSPGHGESRATAPAGRRTSLRKAPARICSARTTQLGVTECHVRRCGRRSVPE